MSSVEPETVLYSKRGPVAYIRLNRPSAINALNMQMRDELVQVLEAMRDDPDVRVAVLRGSGDRGFCSGADLTEFGTAPSQAVARQVRWQRDLWGLFLSIRKPIIAAVHGHVIGAGLEMACLCDIRIASEDAVFGMPEVALGMVPAAGGTQTLPRIAGLGAAMEMLLAGVQMTAFDARRVGLVHHVVTADDLAGEAEHLAVELAARTPEAVTGAKAAVLEGMDLPLEEGLHLEERLTARLLAGKANT